MRSLSHDMRAWLLAVVLLMGSLSGCVGKSKSEDPFAYMGKPLYTGTFDLADFAGGTDGQQFRVVDGSIVTIQLHVNVSATQGSATVSITNPSGEKVVSDTRSIDRRVPVELGVWHVDIESSEGAAGIVDIFVRRG